MTRSAGTPCLTSVLFTPYVLLLNNQPFRAKLQRHTKENERSRGIFATMFPRVPIFSGLSEANGPDWAIVAALPVYNLAALQTVIVETARRVCERAF